MGNTTNKVIELVGNVEVKYNFVAYLLMTHIIFPLQFPAVPPVIRIKNINPEMFCVANKYERFYESDGFITLYLSESQSWASHQNIMRLIQQMQRELSEEFPFFEKRQPFMNGVPQYQPQPQYSNSFQTQGYTQNKPENNFKAGPQQFVPAPNYNGQQPYGGTQSQNNINYEQQVTNRIKQEAEHVLKELLEEFAEEKRIADSVYQLKQVIGQSEANVNQVEEELLLQVEAVSNQIKFINKFIQENDSISVNKDNVSDFIVEANPLQSQILSLVAEKDALKETVAYAESSFKEKRIDFEQLIKATQNLSEQEFDNKLLLKKCISAIQK